MSVVDPSADAILVGAPFKPSFARLRAIGHVVSPEEKSAYRIGSGARVHDSGAQDCDDH